MADASAGFAPDEFFVGMTGAIWLADVGATFPASYSAVPSDVQWTGLGYTSEAGPTFTFDQTVKKITSWQTERGVRNVATARVDQVALELQQWRAENLLLAFGGGTITAEGDGARFEPPAAGVIQEYALIIEGRDGANVVRLCFEKVAVADSVELGFKREEESRFPLTLDVLQGETEGEASWFLQTNLEDIVAAATT